MELGTAVIWHDLHGASTGFE
jgi:hypothetical protein